RRSGASSARARRHDRGCEREGGHRHPGRAQASWRAHGGQDGDGAGLRPRCRPSLHRLRREAPFAVHRLRAGRRAALFDGLCGGAWRLGSADRGAHRARRDDRAPRARPRRAPRLRGEQRARSGFHRGRCGDAAMSMFLDEGYEEKRQFKLSEKLILINWPFLLLIVAIVSFGIAALYSVAGGTLEPWASRQVVRFCLGLAVLFAVALSDLRWWLRAAYPLYGIALVLLALVMVIGVESGGARRWLGYGELTFQPSAMMKIALILALARYYQWLPPGKLLWPHALLVPLAMIGLPVMCALAQPDLGTAMLFGVVGSSLLFLAVVSSIYYLGGVVGVIVVLPHVWERLHDYQKERVLTFIDPERDPL